MKILVIGAGMYVTGRGGSGVGTVLSSLAEASRQMPIDVVVASTTAANENVVNDAMARINGQLGTALVVEHVTISGEPHVDIPPLCACHKFSCAIVAIPDHLHFEYTAVLLCSGVHPLVVKPFVPTLSEAKQLVELQQASGLYGAVEFHKRFDETNLVIKRMLDNATLGKLLYFTVDYSQKINIPLDIFSAWSHNTNIFQYLGVHYVDLIYFLTGYIPCKALAIGVNGILLQSGVNTFDSVHASIIWCSPTDRSNWFVSQFNTNWIDPVCTSAMSDQKYKVIGTRGRIECDQKNRGVELVHEDLGIQQINPYFSDYLPDPDGRLRFGGYGHKSIALFLQDVQNLQTMKTDLTVLDSIRPSFRQSLVSTAVIEAVNASLNNNSQWQDIDEIF